MRFWSRRTALKTVTCSAASSLRAWAPHRALPSETWPPSRSSIATLVDFRVPGSTCEKSGPTDRELCLLAMFRPQGFETLATVSFPPIRAGLVSCRQRSWDFSLRSIFHSSGGHASSAMPNPPTVFPCGYTKPLSQQGRPRKAAVPGFKPGRASLAHRDRGLVHHEADAPMDSSS